MRITSVVITLLLLTFIACDDMEQYTPVSHVPADSVTLENIHPETVINYYPSDSGLLISYIAESGNKIIYYDLDKRQKVDSMDFDIQDFDEEYYPDPEKNLYVFNPKENALVFKDSSGNKKRYTIAKEVVHTGWDSFVTTYSGICPTLEVSDSVFIMNILHGFHLADSRERPKYYSTENLACLKIQGDSLVKADAFALFPDFYKKNFINEPWASATRAGNEVYYIFSNDNVLFRYNILTGKTDSFRVEGLKPNERVPYNMDRIGDISYTSEYEIQISSYVKLLHDAVTGNLVVFQMLPIKEKQNNGMLFLYEDKPMLLNIIDSSMKVIRKIYFENHVRLGIRYSFFNNGNIYIPERFSHSMDRTSIKLYIYHVARR